MVKRWISQIFMWEGVSSCFPFKVIHCHWWEAGVEPEFLLPSWKWVRAESFQGEQTWASGSANMILWRTGTWVSLAVLSSCLGVHRGLPVSRRTAAGAGGALVPSCTGMGPLLPWRGFFISLVVCVTQAVVLVRSWLLALGTSTHLSFTGHLVKLGTNQL